MDKVMKNLIIVLLSCLVITSCSSGDNKIDEPKVDTIKVFDNVVSELKMDNPSVFLGTDFITFFQTLYAFGDFEKMLYFTSLESIKKHGLKKVIKHYNNMEFKYKMKLINFKFVDGKYIMSYETEIFATKGIKRFTVVVENDSCKIVLPDNLNDF